MNTFVLGSCKGIDFIQQMLTHDIACVVMTFRYEVPPCLDFCKYLFIGCTGYVSVIFTVYCVLLHHTRNLDLKTATICTFAQQTEM